MFGNRLQTTLAVEEPWKQFQGRNVQDLSEAAKLLYDVDIQINSKEAAYMVYDHKLRVITDMPATLEECSRLIRDMSFAKGPRDEEPWKVVARASVEGNDHWSCAGWEEGIFRGGDEV